MQQKNREKDQQALIEKMSSLQEVFKHPSRELFESIFVKDCDYITFTGERIQGVDKNYELHLQLVNLWIMKGASLEVHVDKVRFLSETVAVVICTGGIRFRWQKVLPKNRLSVNTNVLVKEEGIWRIASFQNTRIKSMGILMKLFSKKK